MLRMWLLFAGAITACPSRADHEDVHMCSCRVQETGLVQWLGILNGRHVQGRWQLLKSNKCVAKTEQQVTLAEVD